jgi:hypothetical protein
VKGVSLLFGVVAIGCAKREAPRDFKLELPEFVLSRDPVTVAVHLTNQEGAVSRSQDELPLLVEPSTLASVTPRGNLTCQNSGDGSVVLTLGDVTRKATLRCRLVEKVDASDVGRVEFSNGAFKPKIRVLGTGGVELNDVELLLSSRTSEVLFPKGSELLPKSVGTAVIVARAGQVSQEFKVDVVKKVTPEALPLDGGRRIHFSLQPGKYELSVALPQEKKLSAEWRGAPYCNYSGISREHVSTCVLRTKGGVVFDNPAFLASGSDEASVEGVSLHEVP